MCSSSKPKPPPVYPEAPVSAPDSSRAAGAANRKDLAQKRARTQGGTLLTGSQGLQSQANTQKKTLLGA